jgi:hypothetical protein
MQTEIPYTQSQWQVLDAERQEVIRSVADYLSGEKLGDQPTNETLSETLNLLRLCTGCVPAEEIDNSLELAIRRKFAAVYEIGVKLANLELLRQGHQPGQDFHLKLIIDPAYEDFTLVAVVDANRPHCYLQDDHKAWHFHFESLADIADAVLGVRNRLVKSVADCLVKRLEIFVVLDGGLVREVVHCPGNVQITVVDYDIEGADNESVQPSPLNGQPCCLLSF